jgi:hypothetical protein
MIIIGVGTEGIAALEVLCCKSFSSILDVLSMPDVVEAVDLLSSICAVFMNTIPPMTAIAIPIIIRMVEFFICKHLNM